MFAVIKTGGKQYCVKPGDILQIERLAAEPGERVQFDDVLMLVGSEVVVGTPRVAGAAVLAEVLDQIRGEKIIHFVKRRRKHSSQRTKGHRQYLTVVKIAEILPTGAEATGVKRAIGTGAPQAVITAAQATDQALAQE